VRLPDWRLRLSSLDYGFQLDSNSVYKHPAWTLVEILRTRGKSLPFASFRCVARLAEKRYDLLWRFPGKLGLPGMPDESL
jgi:hypothetical protein